MTRIVQNLLYLRYPTTDKSMPLRPDLKNPVEIKAGKTGTLRSLHSFIDQSGAKFTLLNLPYCFASKIKGYIKWSMENK